MSVSPFNTAEKLSFCAFFMVVGVIPLVLLFTPARTLTCIELSLSTCLRVHAEVGMETSRGMGACWLVWQQASSVADNSMSACVF